MSTAAGLGQALGLGLQTGVQTGLQNLFANFQKEQKATEQFEQTKSKFKEQAPILLDKFSKSFITKEQLDALTPEQRKTIQDDAFEGVEKGLDPATAFEAAFLKREQKKKETKEAKAPITREKQEVPILKTIEDLVQKQKGPLAKPEGGAIFNTIQKRLKEGKSPLSSLKGGILDLIKGTAEERTGAKELKENVPSAPARAIASGFLEGAEGISDLFSPQKLITKALGGKPLSAPSQLLDEGISELPEEQQIAFNQLKNIGRAGFEATFASMLSKIGKAGQFAEEAVKKPPKVVPREIPKPIRATKELPEGITAARVSKVAPSKLFKTAEEVALREKQLKNFPKFTKEIEADAAKRFNKSLRIKRAETFAKEEARMFAGENQIKGLTEITQKQRANVRAIEEEISTLKGINKENAQSMLKFNQQELTKAEEELEKAISLSRTGKVKATTEELNQAALKRLDKLTEQVSDVNKRVSLSKQDFNPERVKEFKRLSEQKAVPGKSIDDFHQKTMKIYKEQYQNRLKEVSKEIAIATKQKNLQEMLVLRRERDALKKMIDQVDANFFLHDRTMKLRQIEQQKKISTVLKRAQKVTEPRITKIAQEKIASDTRIFGKNPSSKNLDTLSSKSGQSKQTLSSGQKQTSDFSKALNEVKQFEQGANETKASFIKRKLSKIKEEVTNFISTFKKSPAKALLETPEGLSLLGNLVLATTEAVFGRRIPYGPTLITTLIGRGGTSRLISVIFRAIVSPAIRVAKGKIEVSKFEKALEKGDTEEIIKLRPKTLPKFRKEAARRLREKT